MFHAFILVKEFAVLPCEQPVQLDLTSGICNLGDYPDRKQTDFAPLSPLSSTTLILKSAAPQPWFRRTRHQPQRHRNDRFD